jgi:uncharacterized membrane protein
LKEEIMRTLSKVYDTHAQARQVVTDLNAAGIPDSRISMAANKYVSAEYEDLNEYSEAATGAGVGAAIGGAGGLLAGLGIIAIPGVGPVVAAGWLATTLLGAAAGAATGGIVGALVDAGVPEEDAHVYSEAVRRGGTLVTVQAEDAEATRVQSILERHRPIDARLRREEYVKTGWKGYDPSAKPYDLTEAERERIRAPYVP